VLLSANRCPEIRRVLIIGIMFDCIPGRIVLRQTAGSTCVYMMTIVEIRDWDSAETTGLRAILIAGKGENVESRQPARAR
jgi:hypothetical protein